jgi:hypothetical protein
LFGIATKLDSSQLFGDSNEKCNQTWFQDNYRCEDSNERCNLNLSSKQL